MQNGLWYIKRPINEHDHKLLLSCRCLLMSYNELPAPAEEEGTFNKHGISRLDGPGCGAVQADRQVRLQRA